MDVWEDFGHADLADAAYEDAGWAEARLLSLPPPGRRLAIAEEAQFQTRELALRLLVTDERLWHERPEASLEVSELAVLVAEAAARRKGSHLRLLGRRRTTRRGLPEILVGSGRGAVGRDPGVPAARQDVRSQTGANDEGHAPALKRC